MEDIIKNKLNELLEEFRSMQHKQGHTPMIPLEKPSCVFRKKARDLQDSMDHLRISVKYILFDLEATRRENQYLRKLLEEQK